MFDGFEKEILRLYFLFRFIVHKSSLTNVQLIMAYSPTNDIVF